MKKNPVENEFVMGWFAAFALFAFAVILSLLMSGCCPDPESACTSVSNEHRWGRWSDPAYVNSRGTNLFLGVAMNLEQLQYRKCENCGQAERRLVR